MPVDPTPHQAFTVPASLPEPDGSTGSDGKSKSELKSLFDERQKVLHWVYVWGIRIAFFCICVVFAIRIYHFITPYSWQWLCELQLQVLDKFLFSGVIGALIGKNFDKAIKDMSSDSK